MNFPSLLSDHEQRAFSDFLNQLAQEDSSNHSNTDGSKNAGTADPSLTQQQQQQLQLQLQHHLHLRQLQQQHQQQQQAQSGATGVPRLPPPPSLLSPSMSLDPSAAQQLALAQQQRDWIQQISANPLLAPGGVINPHAMSQAMLQNPLLMAQANAISQAMVLAQQQQQLQLQMQQQQQQQQQHQHFQQHQHQQQQQQQLDSHHSMHHHPFAPPSNNNILPPFHMQQQQYPGQQHRLHSSQEPLSPSSESGPPGIQMQSTEPPTKRKSRATSAGGAPDKIVESSSSRSSSPFSPSTMNSQHTQADPEAMSTNGSNHISKQESDVENGFAPPPSKKSSRRKGSTAKSLSMDASSGLVVKSAHRSSRDGYDPLQGNPRKKGRGESISKNGASQQNKGNTPDLDVHKEKTEGMDGNDKESSPMPSAPPQDSPTPSQNSSSGQVQPKSGSKKPHHELLTEAEKKANHIASEQKRRQNIRVGFDSLVEIVPTLSDCHRSEAVILQKSVEYIHRLMNQKNELKSRVRDLQAHLGDPLEDMDSASDMEVEQDE